MGTVFLQLFTKAVYVGGYTFQYFDLLSLADFVEGFLQVLQVGSTTGQYNA